MQINGYLTHYFLQVFLEANSFTPSRSKIFMKFIAITISLILAYKVRVGQLSNVVYEYLKIQLRSTEVCLGPYRISKSL